MQALRLQQAPIAETSTSPPPANYYRTAWAQVDMDAALAGALQEEEADGVRIPAPQPLLTPDGTVAYNAYPTPLRPAGGHCCCCCCGHPICC